MQDKRNIENVVQEIMGLVDAYYKSGAQEGFLLRSNIQSKLRELVREQEEKIRVAVARYNLASEIIEARSKERSNNITKDS